MPALSEQIRSQPLDVWLTLLRICRETSILPFDAESLQFQSSKIPDACDRGPGRISLMARLQAGASQQHSLMQVCMKGNMKCGSVFLAVAAAVAGSGFLKGVQQSGLASSGMTHWHGMHLCVRLTCRVLDQSALANVHFATSALCKRS